MSTHRVIVLGVVAAIALGAALWSSQTRRSDEVPVAPEVVPGLEAGINDVSEVRIRTAGDALQATIKRVDADWVLVERDNYPADVDGLRRYLLKLARAKRIESKTDTPALYEKLGVEAIDVATASGVQIEIDGLKQPVKLIVGRNVPRGSGSYVRHAGEAQSWQADTDLAVEKLTANWLQRDLIDIAAGRVQRVEITPESGAKIEIVRSAEGASGDFAVANLPKGREPASEFVGDATAGLLAGLRFDDVLSAAQHAPPAAGVTRAQFTTEEGIVVALTAWKDGDKTNAQLIASLDEAKAIAFVEQTQAKAVREHDAVREAAKSDAEKASEAAASSETPSDDEAVKEAAAKDEIKPEASAPTESASVESAPLAVTDPPKDREQRLTALRSDVERMNARFKDKTFVLPAFKAGNLHKTLEDYLKPKA